MVRYARYNVAGGLRKKPKAASTWTDMSEAQNVEEESESQLAALAEIEPPMKKKKLKSKVTQFSAKGLDEYDVPSKNSILPSTSTSGIAAEIQKNAPAQQGMEIVNKKVKNMDTSVKNKVQKSKKKKINVSGEVEQQLKKIKEDNKGTLTAEEEKELEVYIKKDHRREERRQKRADERQNSKVCFNCREAGHIIADCPKMTKSRDKSGIEEYGTGMCFKCGSMEHKVDKCRVKLPPGEFPYATCFICKETGHLSSQCVDNPRGLYPNGGCCALCGSVEHYKRDCPEQQKAKGIPDIRLNTLMSAGSADDDLLDVKAPTVVRKKGPKIVKF